MNLNIAKLSLTYVIIIEPNKFKGAVYFKIPDVKSTEQQS